MELSIICVALCCNGLRIDMKIDFEFETPYGKFADALWFSDDEPTPSDIEIEILKQQRLNDWLAIFTEPVNG
jgi:hypothetical protein